MIDRLVYRESVGFRQKKDCLGTIPLTVFFFCWFFVVTVWGTVPRQSFFCCFFSCWLHGQRMRLLDLR